MGSLILNPAFFLLAPLSIAAFCFMVGVGSAGGMCILGSTVQEIPVCLLSVCSYRPIHRLAIPLVAVQEHLALLLGSDRSGPLCWHIDTWGCMVREEGS